MTDILIFQIIIDNLEFSLFLKKLYGLFYVLLIDMSMYMWERSGKLWIIALCQGLFYFKPVISLNPHNNFMKPVLLSSPIVKFRRLKPREVK